VLAGSATMGSSKVKCRFAICCCCRRQFLMDQCKILVWNVRGLNSSASRKIRSRSSYFNCLSPRVQNSECYCSADCGCLWSDLQRSLCCSLNWCQWWVAYCLG
jgi:hypothetical protein